MEDIILLGSGGHSKSIVDMIEEQELYHIIGFLELPEKKEFSYRGYHVIGDDSQLPKLYNKGIKYAFPAMGHMGRNNIHEKLIDEVVKIGFCVPNIIDTSAIIAKDVEIPKDSGIFIGKRVVINSNAQIGKGVIINTGAIIEHDCMVEDETHVAVGAIVCGEVHIGRACLIGAGSTIRQCLSVGAHSIVGAGSVVLDHVSEGRIIYGNPAKEHGVLSGVD